MIVVALSMHGIQVDIALQPITYSQISFVFWLNSNSANSNMRCFTNSHTDSDNNGFQSYVSTSAGTGNFAAQFGNGTTNNNVSATGLTNPQNAYFHYAATYNGLAAAAVNNAFIYLSGQQVAVSSSHTGALTASGFDIWISGNPSYNGDFVGGSMADVALWSCALSPTEIAALASRQLRPHQIRWQSLQGFWPLDGYGAPAKDYGPHKINGKLSNVAQVLAAGPLNPAPILIRPPPMITAAAAAGIVFRRSRSLLGTRVGSRQGTS